MEVGEASKKNHNELSKLFTNDYQLINGPTNHHLTCAVVGFLPFDKKRKRV